MLKILLKYIYLAFTLNYSTKNQKESRIKTHDFLSSNSLFFPSPHESSSAPYNLHLWQKGGSCAPLNSKERPWTSWFRTRHIAQSLIFLLPCNLRQPFDAAYHSKVKLLGWLAHTSWWGLAHFTFPSLVFSCAEAIGFDLSPIHALSLT